VLFTGEQDIAGRYRRLFTVLSDNETFKAIDFATVSVSESPEIARRLGVKVVPTVAYGSNSVDVEKSKGTQLLEGGRSAELRKVMTILLNAVDSSSASPAVQKELEAPDTEGTTFANSDKPSALKALADKIDLSMPLHSEDDLELSQTSFEPSTGPEPVRTATPPSSLATEQASLPSAPPSVNKSLDEMLAFFRKGK